MEKIQIHDESNDRRYFTIIPNYILNHSTANDQALYLQMKRIAGENGECFASINYLCKKLGIGEKALKKSIKYLIQHKWIAFIGKKKTKEAKTAGGFQMTNVYVVNDIWKLNNNSYEQGGVESDHPVNQGGVESNSRWLQKEGSGGVESSPKEEPINKILEEDIETQSVSGTTNSLILLFKDLNPSFERLYPNKNQRAALERMVKKYGLEKVASMIRALPDIVSKQYAPQITTPIQLENKLGELILFVKKSQNNKINITI